MFPSVGTGCRSPDIVEAVEQESITIFAPRLDHAAVARLFRTAGTVTLGDPTSGSDEPVADDAWRSMSLVVGARTSGWLARAGHDGGKTITLFHDPAYYDVPEWPERLARMQRVVSGFAHGVVTPELLDAIAACRVAIACTFSPTFSFERPDPRRPALNSLVRILGGMTYTPNSLRDERGLVMVSSELAPDPHAATPGVEPGTVR